MTKHTKGPWYCKSKPAQRYPVVFSGETKVARAITSKLSEHEIEANVNLITTAPDMLAALEVCLEAIQPYYDSDDDGSLEAKASNMALAAINKAKGI